MVASTDIKFYVHTNTNAPQLTNNYGCMIDVLDACLVNGFGSQTVSTLTASGTTVTATFGSAHNFMQYQVIKITGATQTEYNGEFRILTIPDSSSLTFELATAPSVTTATGTIVFSLPPLGWEKPFSSAGKAAYRSLNLLLPSRPFLRVVDELDPVWTSTYAKYAKVGIVEDMTDIDTMSGVQAPYDSGNPDKNWVGTGSGATAINGWAKWYYARSGNARDNTTDASEPLSANRNYLVVGNSDTFYIIPHISTGNYGVIYGFGAFDSFIQVDTSNTFLMSTLNYVNASASYVPVNFTTGASNHVRQLIVFKKYDQLRQYQLCHLTALNPLNSASFMSGTASGISNDLPITNCFIFENNQVVRGDLPLLKWKLNAAPMSDLQVFHQNGKIMLNKFVSPYQSYDAAVVFDVGGL